MADLEYWIIGGTFAVCGFAFFCVVVPLYAWRHVGAGNRPPLPVGQPNTKGMNFVDVLGVGAFFGIYAAIWLSMAMGVGDGKEAGPENDTEMVILLVSSLFMQVMFVGFVVLLLVWRTNMVELFGLRFRKWYLAPVFAVLVTFLVYSFNAVLGMAGYTEWINGLLGTEDTAQDAVKLMQESDGWVTGILMALIACVGAPLSEEIVFRGYIYGAVKKFSNIGFSMVFSGLFFAAVHMNVASLLPLFVLGVALAAVYELTGSLWTPIAVHCLFNSVSTVLINLQRIQPELFEEMAK